MTTESLPPENNITGRSNSAATSRMIVTDSSIRLRNADFTLLRLGLLALSKCHSADAIVRIARAISLTAKESRGATYKIKFKPRNFGGA